MYEVWLHVILIRRRMGDEGCPHVAARDYLEVNNMELLPHSANSPDLNPIANLLASMEYDG